MSLIQQGLFYMKSMFLSVLTISLKQAYLNAKNLKSFLECVRNLHTLRLFSQSERHTFKFLTSIT